MVLSNAERAFLAGARTATLATIGPDGVPRLVPVCFVLDGATLYTPIDDKPKSTTDPKELARARDIERRPDVTLLVHHWDEDWSNLAWLRVTGEARLIPPNPAVTAALRAKYPQYASHDLEHRPVIAVALAGARGWGDLSGRGRPPSPSAEGSGSSSSPGGSPRR